MDTATVVVMAGIAAISLGLIAWAGGRHLMDLWERSQQTEPGYRDAPHEPEDDPMAETEYAVADARPTR